MAFRGIVFPELRRMRQLGYLALLGCFIYSIGSYVERRSTFTIPRGMKEYSDDDRQAFPQDKKIMVENKTETMSYDPVILHPPTIGEKYAVFSASTPPATNHKVGDFNYVFYLPLTARAWKRIGYSSIVLITGDVKTWKNRPELNVILQELIKCEATVVFLPCDVENCVLIAMVARLFVSSILPWDVYMRKQRNKKDTKITMEQTTSSVGEIPSLNNTLLLTTDADLWPLSANMFHFPRGHHKKIVVTNFPCCGKFKYSDGNSYDMLAMTSITMTVETWRQVMFPFGGYNNITTSRDIHEHIRKMFPEADVENKVKKGSQVWYTDQKLVSFRVAKWLKDKDKSTMETRRRNTGKDRVDRSYWNTDNLGEHLNDSHLVTNGFFTKPWAKLLPLLQYMYLISKSLITDFSNSLSYRERFRVELEAVLGKSL